MPSAVEALDVPFDPPIKISWTTGPIILLTPRDASEFRKRSGLQSPHWAIADDCLSAVRIGRAEASVLRPLIVMALEHDALLEGF